METHEGITHVPKMALEVVDEREAQEPLRDENGRVVPTFIKQHSISLEKRREDTVHALYDAKPPEVVFEEALPMDLERWSRIVERLDKRQQVKLDANVSVLGLIGLFPVVKEVESSR